MNTSIKAIKTLCYGDSNTWGYIPGTGKRYPVNIRWTGILQRSLGDNYCIVEEGLNSRTTVLDDPTKAGKNGKTTLLPCINKHCPIDIIILMLGTNDLKERFNRSPEQIASGIEELLNLIDNIEYDEGKKPKIILISPPIVDESVNGVKEKYLGAEEKSKQLGKLYQQIADKYHLRFIDLAPIVFPSKVDGYHLEPESHKKIAELLTIKIKSISVLDQ